MILRNDCANSRTGCRIESSRAFAQTREVQLRGTGGPGGQDCRGALPTAGVRVAGPQPADQLGRGRCQLPRAWNWRGFPVLLRSTARRRAGDCLSSRPPGSFRGSPRHQTNINIKQSFNLQIHDSHLSLYTNLTEKDVSRQSDTGGIEERRSGRSGSYELSLRRADGTLVECINNATPLFDTRGNRVGSVGLWTEISRIKAAERELARAKASLDQALASMADGFLLCDAQGRVVTWNPRYLEIFPHLCSVIAPGVPFRRLAEAGAWHQLPHGTDAERSTWVERRIGEQARGDSAFEIRMRDGATSAPIGSRSRSSSAIPASALPKRACRASSNIFRRPTAAWPAASVAAVWGWRYAGRSLI